MSKALRHFLDLNEIPTKELRNMLAASLAMKATLKASKKEGVRPKEPLQGKTLAMIFENPRPGRECRSTSACASSAVNRSC